MTERTYKSPYTALVPKDGQLIKNLIMSGSPLFPLFCEADLSTFRGFMTLTQRIGINWFAYLDEQTGYDYPLGSEIWRVINEQRKGLPESFIKKFYDRVTDRLLSDHADVRLFHRWFVEGHHPVIEKRLPGMAETKPFPALLLYRLYQEQGWKPKTEEEKRIFKQIDQLYRSLYNHLNRVRLGLTTIPFPPFFDIVEKLSKAAKTSRIRSARIFTHPEEYPRTLDKALKGFSLRKASRKCFQWGLLFDSLPSRCYLEMLDLLEDDKDIRKCAHCGLIFIPLRIDEEFCNRIIPGSDWSYKSPTCKKIGPQKRFESELRKDTEKGESRKEYKRFHARLSYLRKTEQTGKYYKAMKEFKTWGKQHQPKVEANHGTKARKK